MAYIEKLKKNKMVKSFFRGYVPLTSEVNGLMRWDSVKASKDAGFLVDSDNDNIKSKE